MQIPAGLFYTKTHEWVKRSDGEALVGITAHAQEELGDIVFVELPQVGKAVKQGEAVAVVESVKAAFDVYAPVSGTLSRVNTALSKSPQLVNQECYDQGWFFAITTAHPEEYTDLLSAEEYTKLIQTATQ